MYATSPNQTATDGDGQNSPFAEAIVNNIRTPGQNLNTFLDRVGADVMQATGGEQTPHISKLFFGEFSFVPTAASLTNTREATSLLISGLPVDSRVEIAGMRLSASGTTTVSDLPPGSHELRVVTPLYPDGYVTEVTLEAGTPVISQIPAGTLVLSGLPQGATARLAGTDILHGEEADTTEVRLLPGSYDLEVRGTYVEPLYRSVSIGEGRRVELPLEIVEYGLLDLSLPDGDVVVDVYSPEDAVSVSWDPETRLLEPGSYEVRARWADDTDWGFSQTVGVVARSPARVNARSLSYSPTYQIGALTAERTGLVSLIDRGRTHRTVSTAGFIGGAAGAVVGVLSYVLARSTYTRYQAAGTTPEAEALAGRIRTFSSLALAGGGLAGAGLSAGLVFRLLTPNTRAAAERVQTIEVELDRLQGDDE